METDQIKEMDVEVLSSMWPEDVGTEAETQFNVEKPNYADLKRLPEIMKMTPEGSSELTKLVKQWAYVQENAVRLLREELKNLTRQREEAVAKQLKIIEESENLPVLDETSDLFRKGDSSSSTTNKDCNQFGNSASTVEESTNNLE